MDCDAVQRLVHVFIDDEVSRAVASEIESHLETCLACRLLVHRLHRLDDILNGTTALPVPDGFSSRVLAAARRRLMQDVASANPASPLPHRPFHRITALDAVAAAVMVLGLSLGTWMASQTWRQVEGSEDAAGAVVHSTQDIDGFYGAGSEGFDAQRPLLQAYMAVVDRNSLGE